MLLVRLGSVRIGKNCHLGLENDVRPGAAFSRPRSQIFSIQIDPKPANNIYVLHRETVFKGALSRYLGTL